MHIQGLIAAPFTAMHFNGEINLGAIEHQARLLAHNRVKGAFVCGTTGEGMSLTIKERKAVTEHWLKVAPDNFSIFVHVGHACLEDAKDLAAHAQNAGAAAISALGPTFFKPGTVDDLVDYCRAIAAAAPRLPFYYYHMPEMTGLTFPMITFLEKAAFDIPNLAGIKFTYEDTKDFQLCRQFQSQRFDILFGRDEILLSGLNVGARGAVGSTYNYMAPLFYQIIDAFNQGDSNRAQQLQSQALQIITTMQETKASFLAVGKAMMKLAGIDCGPVRLPLRNITPTEYDILIKKLDELEFSTCKCRMPSGQNAPSRQIT